jgi:uncharacterized protein YbcV (DUF1398 family)
MDERVTQVIQECVRGSDEGRMAFPEVIGMLSAAGIERYYADLQRAEKTFYMPSGESCIVGSEKISTRPPDVFDPAGVEAAIRAVQAKSIGYKEFCDRIAAAGCVGYLVSLPGRRAVYLGRGGDSFVEPFPPVAR